MTRASTTLAESLSEPDQRDERLRFLLDVLLTDGYLDEVGDRFPFKSKLLREFWKRRVAPS